jgi:hypothetical protein
MIDDIDSPSPAACQDQDIMKLSERCFAQVRYINPDEVATNNIRPDEQLNLLCSA